MSVVNYETGEIVDPFAFVWQTIGADDASLTEGLDDKTARYVLARVAENEALRIPLAQAAVYRKHHQRPRRTTKQRQVYFIAAESTGLIKIGNAADPVARMATLQTGSPDHLSLLATIPGGAARERDLHRRFASARRHGEWFEPTSDLLTFISEQPS